MNRLNERLVLLVVVVLLILFRQSIPELQVGDIVFQDFKDGIVYLNMQGSCSGCPSSTATLKMGIENMLKHYVPEVKEVRPVDA